MRIMWQQLKNPHLYFMVFADILLFALSLVCSYLFRFEFQLTASEWAQIFKLLPIAIPLKCLCYYQLGLYQGMWRYTDIRDSWKLLQAGAIASVLLVVIVVYLERFEGYSRSVFIIDGLLTFILTGGLRACIRTFYRFREQLQSRIFLLPSEYRRRRKRLQRVLIIGAGDAGEKMLREIIENPELAYQVVGFLDDDPAKKGRSVHGVFVLGTIADLPLSIQKFDIQQVLIAMPSASGAQMRHVANVCRQCDVPFKTLPGLGELMNGKASLNDLREVSYADLLGRKPIRLDTASITEYIKGQAVLVSGAGGSIGSELCRQIIRFSPRLLILVEASELNLYSIQTELQQEIGFHNIEPVLGRIQDKDHMERIFEESRPDVVFHAAAYKHVPILEDYPWMAVDNNIWGSLVLMQTAQKFDTRRFVLVSTDKAVRPNNVMGASKRITELIMHGLNGDRATKFMAVRFGNVVGSSGSVIPLFKRQISYGGPITLTHPDMTRYFMTISEASQLILQAGALGQGGEIFILEMGAPIRIADMARDLISLMGKEPDKDIEITYTGLRPGEKIHEELITDEEDIVPTRHKDIMVLKRNGNGANHAAYLAWLIEQILQIREVASKQDIPALQAKITEIVPEYTPGRKSLPQGVELKRKNTQRPAALIQ